MESFAGRTFFNSYKRKLKIEFALFYNNKKFYLVRWTDTDEIFIEYEETINQWLSGVDNGL